MNVYCSHPSAQPYGSGGYLVCGICGAEWYTQDPAPLSVIGVTNIREVKRYPFLRSHRDKKLT